MEIRGKKQEPKLTNSQRIREIDVELKNAQVGARLNQMMIQQMLQNFQTLSADLGKAYGIVSELQYKVLAMQSVGSFDMTALAKKADELRLNDFVEASDAADKSGNFTIGEKVENDSTVILTSTTPGEDAGIFRSRLKLADCGVPALIEGLAGKAVGTKLTCRLNDKEHTVELLGIRNPPPPAPVEQEVVVPAGATIN